MGSQNETAPPECLDGSGEAGFKDGTINGPYHSRKGLQQHLLKISRQKVDSKQMVEVLLSNRDWMVPHYAGDRTHDLFDLQISNCSALLSGCGSWLLFGQHRESMKVELLRAHFCQQTYLCLFCQARRSYRNITAYQDKLKSVDGVRLLVTLTIPNCSDLVGGILTLKNAFRKLWNRAKQKGQGPFRDAIGAVTSIEITSGKDGLWHPHMHCILVMNRQSKGFLKYTELREEWCKLTGGRQIRVDLMRSENDLTEALKYTVKPQQAGADGLALLQRAKVWALLAGKRIRMLQPYGVLKGVAEDLALDLEFNPAEWDLFFYRWLFGSYVHVPVDVAKLAGKRL